ncbi:MAG TPA: helix-turn-helix domain-containing protein [Candidatus Nanoarchaeia archaeon]|nr:helix-turn-helix domain-containing protein [Candidatus Nanoarchaeia archaeon]
MQTQPTIERTAVPSEYFVTAQEAAKFLQINPRTLLHMARNGSVPAYPLGDGIRKTWRFLLSDLAEWLRRRSNASRLQ